MEDARELWKTTMKKNQSHFFLSTMHYTFHKWLAICGAFAFLGLLTLQFWFEFFFAFYPQSSKLSSSRESTFPINVCCSLTMRACTQPHLPGRCECKSPHAWLRRGKAWKHKRTVTEAHRVMWEPQAQSLSPNIQGRCATRVQAWSLEHLLFPKSILTQPRWIQNRGVSGMTSSQVDVRTDVIGTEKVFTRSAAFPPSQPHSDQSVYRRNQSANQISDTYAHMLLYFSTLACPMLHVSAPSLPSWWLERCPEVSRPKTRDTTEKVWTNVKNSFQHQAIMMPWGVFLLRANREQRFVSSCNALNPIWVATLGQAPLAAKLATYPWVPAPPEGARPASRGIINGARRAKPNEQQMHGGSSGGNGYLSGGTVTWSSSYG